MAKRATFAFASLAAGVCLLAACNGGAPPKPVSEAEALGMLHTAVGYAQAGQTDKLCADLGAPESSCRDFLARVGPDSVPADPPRVIESVPIPDEKDPGWLLTVCGVDGLGRPYTSGFTVYRLGHDDGLLANYPVYWSNVPIAIVQGGETVTTTAGAAPRGCPE